MNFRFSLDLLGPSGRVVKCPLTTRAIELPDAITAAEKLLEGPDIDGLRNEFPELEGPDDATRIRVVGFHVTAVLPKRKGGA